MGKHLVALDLKIPGFVANRIVNAIRDEGDLPLTQRRDCARRGRRRRLPRCARHPMGPFELMGLVLGSTSGTPRRRRGTPRLATLRTRRPRASSSASLAVTSVARAVERLVRLRRCSDRGGSVKDMLLTEDQRDFQALAREFLDRHVVPHRAGLGPRRVRGRRDLPEARDSLGSAQIIPEEHGGVGGATTAPTASPSKSSAARTRRCAASSRCPPGWSRQDHLPAARNRPTAQGAAPRPGERTAALVLRPDRAEQRLGPGEPAGSRVSSWFGRRHDRFEDLHHQRHLGRRASVFARTGPGWSARHLGVPRAHGHVRFRGPTRSRQARAPRSGHRRDPSSTTSSCRPTPCSARRAAASGSRCARPSTGQDLRCRRVCGHRAGFARGGGRVRRAATLSSAARSPGSSWSRT